MSRSRVIIFESRKLDLVVIDASSELAVVILRLTCQIKEICDINSLEISSQLLLRYYTQDLLFSRQYPSFYGYDHD
jgi:hypothetical protein